MKLIIRTAAAWSVTRCSARRGTNECRCCVVTPRQDRGGDDSRMAGWWQKSGSMGDLRVVRWLHCECKMVVEVVSDTVLREKWWQRRGMQYIVWWQGGRATYCPRSSFNYWRCLVRLVAAVNRVVGRSGRHNSPGRLKNYLSSTGTMLQLLLTAGCIVCPGWLVVTPPVLIMAKAICNISDRKEWKWQGEASLALGATWLTLGRRRPWNVSSVPHRLID